MPDQDAEALAVIELHAGCRRNGVLPCVGGFMDQPALLLDLFDLIDVSAEKERAKKNDEMMSNMEKDRMLLEQKRGRRRGG
jgi:hypothetical protein